MALFESGVEDDDEDEDYSMNEDMLKNQKRYKFDEQWQAKNRITVPKSEIHRLIADQRKEVQETFPSRNNSANQKMQQPVMGQSGGNQINNPKKILSKRRVPFGGSSQFDVGNFLNQPRSIAIDNIFRED